MFAVEIAPLPTNTHSHTLKSILHKDESTEKKGLSLAHFAACMFVSGQVEAFSGGYFCSSMAGSQIWRYLGKGSGCVCVYATCLCICVGVLFSKTQSMLSVLDEETYAYGCSLKWIKHFVHMHMCRLARKWWRYFLQFCSPVSVLP